MHAHGRSSASRPCPIGTPRQIKRLEAGLVYEMAISAALAVGGPPGPTLIPPHTQRAQTLRHLTGGPRTHLLDEGVPSYPASGRPLGE